MNISYKHLIPQNNASGDSSKLEKCFWDDTIKEACSPNYTHYALVFMLYNDKFDVLLYIKNYFKSGQLLTFIDNKN